MTRFCLGFWPREESTYGAQCFVEGPAQHVVRDGSASPANVARSAQLIAPGLPVRACMHGVDEPSAALLAGWLDVRVLRPPDRVDAREPGGKRGGRVRTESQAGRDRRARVSSARLVSFAPHARRFTRAAR
jgi:hypothetical protein